MINKAPLISVVIVTLNAQVHIENLLKSVLCQDYEPIEIIIIDGASVDTTVEIIEKYSADIDFWISEQDEGIYDAMNKGISRAKGDWIYFIGADDQLLPDSISRVVPYLEDDTTIYYGNVIMPARKRIYDGEFSLFKLANRNIPHQAQFYPKKIWDFYKFSTCYKLYADYELNLKIVGDSRFRLKHIPVVVASFNDIDGVSANHSDAAFDSIKWIRVWDNFPYFIFALGYCRYKLIKLLQVMRIDSFIKKIYHLLLRIQRPLSK